MSTKRIFVTGLTDVSTVDKDIVGSIRWEGNKCYKYVQYKATAIACVAGRMLGFFAADGYKLHQVTMDTSDQGAAGTLLASGVSQAIIPTNGFGWIQIKGAATLTSAIIGSTNDGDPLTLVGATADTGDVDVNVATAANTHICCYAGDESDDEVVVDCPF